MANLLTSGAQCHETRTEQSDMETALVAESPMNMQKRSMSLNSFVECVRDILRRPPVAAENREDFRRSEREACVRGRANRLVTDCSPAADRRIARGP
jgi:hypothetical protein